MDRRLHPDWKEALRRNLNSDKSLPEWELARADHLESWQEDPLRRAIIIMKESDPTIRKILLEKGVKVSPLRVVADRRGLG